MCWSSLCTLICSCVEWPLSLFYLCVPFSIIWLCVVLQLLHSFLSCCLSHCESPLSKITLFCSCWVIFIAVATLHFHMFAPLFLICCAALICANVIDCVMTFSAQDTSQSVDITMLLFMTSAVVCAALTVQFSLTEPLHVVASVFCSHVLADKLLCHFFTLDADQYWSCLNVLLTLFLLYQLFLKKSLNEEYLTLFLTFSAFLNSCSLNSSSYIYLTSEMLCIFSLIHILSAWMSVRAVSI